MIEKDSSLVSWQHVTYVWAEYFIPKLCLQASHYDPCEQHTLHIFVICVSTLHHFVTKRDKCVCVSVCGFLLYPFASLFERLDEILVFFLAIPPVVVATTFKAHVLGSTDDKTYGCFFGLLFGLSFVQP